MGELVGGGLQGGGVVAFVDAHSLSGRIMGLDRAAEEVEGDGAPPALSGTLLLTLSVEIGLEGAVGGMSVIAGSWTGRRTAG